MEFAPVPGIRTETLLDVQKQVDRIAPRVDIEASERSNKYDSSNQQAPDRDPGRDPEQGSSEEELETVEQMAAAAEDDEELPEDQIVGRFSWFV
jgi:hypothetical protein